MNVLLLSPYCSNKLLPVLRQESVFIISKLEAREEYFDWADIVVSYGYRHIIPAHIVRKNKRKIINIHTSFLPWNRGANPNFWSFYDGTPRGTTIHYIDEGVDTGDIIIQVKDDSITKHDTLRTSYDGAATLAEALFAESWPYLKIRPAKAFSQEGDGSFHKKKDLEPVWPHLEWGWDTPVAEVEALGRRDREAKRDMGDRGQAVAGAES